MASCGNKESQHAGPEGWNKGKYFQQNHGLTLQIVPEACEVNKNLAFVGLPS